MKEKLQRYFEELSYYMSNYWRVITIMSLLAILWLGWVLNGIKAAIEENTAVTKQSNQFAIKVNDRNQIEGFEKIRLTDEKLKFVIVGYIERYLVKSAYDLTSRSETKAFANYQEFFDAQLGTGGLKEFYYTFIFTKNQEEKFSELQTSGQESFVTLIKKYFIHLRRKEFPVAIDVLGTDLKDIKYYFNDDKFKLECVVQMVTAGVTVDGISYSNIVQSAHFAVEGYIDINSSDPTLNPLGIRFSKIEATPALTPTDINALRINAQNKKQNSDNSNQDTSGSSGTIEQRY